MFRNTSRNVQKNQTRRGRYKRNSGCWQTRESGADDSDFENEDKRIKLDVEDMNEILVAGRLGNQVLMIMISKMKTKESLDVEDINEILVAGRLGNQVLMIVISKMNLKILTMKNNSQHKTRHRLRHVAENHQPGDRLKEGTSISILLLVQQKV
jgi:hypothetical protein